MSDLNDIARQLAKNVAEHHEENSDEMKIQLEGFYYTKYSEYDISYSVNNSGCTLNLASISTNLSRIFPECREPHRLAIVELDRILKVHYLMEDLLKEILPMQKKEIAERINALLNTKGTEK